MAQYDGSIRINTEIDTNGLLQGEANVKSSMERISSLAKKAVLVIGSVFAVGKIVQFGKEALALGSDLQEVQNVVDVTFTTMSEKVDEFAKNAAVAAGLSETMAKQYVGTFGAMSKSFGFAEDEAYKMSTALTQLAGDVASFYNISQDEAYIKLKSVFTGETETLKDLGVVMTQSALDAYALANGFGKTTSAMSESEKVALRYRFVMERLSGASGDFIRTSGGWANQVRILKLQFDSLKATIGQGLINVFTPVIVMINSLLARLATLANAFKAFTELLTGNKTTGNGSVGLSQKDGESIGAGYDAAAEGAENLAGANEDAAKSAGKAAKAAKGQLSALDKLNNLSSESAGSGGGSGGGAGGDGLAGAVEEVDYGNLAEGETKFEKLGGMLDAIIAKFKELSGLFKNGFFEGLGNYKPRLEELKNDILSIGKTLKEIFTDPGVVAAANGFANQLAYSLGQITGSIASIGLTIAQNLVGGMEKYLTQNKERIKQYIISMFDIGTEIAAIIGDFSVAFADIFSVFGGDAAQQITGNLIGIFAEVGMMISENAAKLGRDILNMITQPIIGNKDKIKDAIEGTLEAIEPFTSGLLEAVRQVRDAVTEIYDSHLKPLFESIADGLSEILGKLLDGYNTYIVPVLQGLGDKFKDIMEGPFGETVHKIKDFVGKLIDAVKLLWENWLVPLFSWLADNVMPVLAPIVDFIGGTVLNAIKHIIKVVGGIADILGGIIDFVVGVFTGDWEKAWNGVKSVFTGVWDIIKSSFSTTWENLKNIVSNGIKLVKAVIKAGWEAVKLVTSTAWDAITNALSAVWEAIKDIFGGVGGWFKDKFDLAYKNVKNAFSGAKSFFTGVWNNVKAVFGNIAEWFKGKFTDAWTAVKNVFSTGGKIFDGIKDGILNGLKTVINAIISGINKVIAVPFNGLNTALSKLKAVNIAGLKPFSFLPNISVPQIPKLATGTVVPPNNEFLAVLGDNKREPEVVSPLSTMKQASKEAVAEVLSELGLTARNGRNGGNETFIFQVDGKTFFEITRKEAQAFYSRTGRPAFPI